MRFKRAIALLTVTLFMVVLPGCQRAPGKGDYSFDAAIDNAATNYPIVRIQLASAQLGEVAHNCVIAAGLVEAIRFEHGLPDDAQGRARARQIAKSTKDYRFNFRKPEAQALLKIKWLDETKAKLACQAIEAGRPAMIGDYAPDLYLGDGKGGWIRVS